MTTRLRFCIAVAALLVLAIPLRDADAQDDFARNTLVEVLEGLERGIDALERLGRHEEVEQLHHIAEEVRQTLRDRRRVHDARAERAARQRALLGRQLDALLMALHALREADRIEAAELLERAIEVREARIQGLESGVEPRVRGRAPDHEQLLELLVFAEDIYRQLGAPDKADRLSALTEELWSDRVRERERRRGRARGERDLEVMRSALPALMEADRRDAAELLERAIIARETGVAPDGTPGPGDLVEILRTAADLWLEFGAPDRARAIDDLARRLLMGGDVDLGRRERESQRGRDRHPDDMLRRIEHLEDQVAALRRMLDSALRRMEERDR